jgi:hypothetical protein
MNAKANDSGDVRACVQTAEQASAYVRVITLVDFGAQKVKRSMVSDDIFASGRTEEETDDSVGESLPHEAQCLMPARRSSNRSETLESYARDGRLHTGDLGRFAAIVDGAGTPLKYASISPLHSVHGALRQASPALARLRAFARETEKDMTVDS